VSITAPIVCTPPASILTDDRCSAHLLCGVLSTQTLTVGLILHPYLAPSRAVVPPTENARVRPGPAPEPGSPC
jgi:hypothetical protein